MRPTRPSDAAGIVDLLNQVYGTWGDQERWRWKYQAPPAGSQPPGAVADLDGQIVGHYGILATTLCLNGETIQGAQAVDAAVLPGYRRQGVFTALGRYALGQASQTGVSLIYAFPGLFSLAMNSRLGFTPLAFVPELTRLLQPGRALKLGVRRLPGDLAALWRLRRGRAWQPDTVRRLARLRRSLLLLASWLSAPRPTSLSPDGGVGQTHVDVRSATDFDARFDRLWDQVSQSVGLSLCKDAAYLTWRYQRHPQKRYDVLVAEQGPTLLGFLVAHHDSGHSQVVDLLALPGRSDVAANLMAAAVAQARRRNSLILTAWVPTGHPYHACLRQNGFVSPHRLHHLARRWPALARSFYQVIVYPPQPATLGETWPLALGDSDLA